MCLSVQRTLSILMLASSIFVLGCIDLEPQSNELSVEDLNSDIEENRAKGDIVGQIIASADGPITFELISSEPMGALSVNADDGTLIVEMPEFFDFEERSEITAQVSATSSIDVAEVRVQLNLINVEAPIEEFNMLTKLWKVDKFSWNGFFASTDNHACRMDDEMRLSGTGMYTYDGGASLCGNEDNQQLKTGTWDLDENLAYILFDKGESNELKVDIDFMEAGKISLSTSYMGAAVSGEFIQD